MFDQNKLYTIEATGGAIVSLLAILNERGSSVKSAKVDGECITVIFVKDANPSVDLTIKIPIAECDTIPLHW